MIQSLFAKSAVFAITVSVALAAAGPVSERVQEHGASVQLLSSAAAAGGRLTAAPNRYGFRSAESRVVERRPMQWLPAEAAETSDDKIIAAFPVTAPESVAEDIAKDYGLELIDRHSSPGLFIILYRVPDARPLSTVVESLRADRRVTSAQILVRYVLTPPMHPPTADGGPREPPAARTMARHFGKRRASPERTTDRKIPGVKTGDRRAHAKGNEQLGSRTRVGNLTSLKPHSKERCFMPRRFASLSEKTADGAVLGPASKDRRMNRKGRDRGRPVVKRHRTGVQTSLSRHEMRGEPIALLTPGAPGVMKPMRASFIHSMLFKGYALISFI